MTGSSSLTRPAIRTTPGEGLTVTEVAARCHLSDSTLRMWERRYGFPRPRRDRWGNRRYEPVEVGRIEEVLRLRDSGLSLPAAVARVGQEPVFHSPSLFAELRSLGARQLRDVTGPALALVGRALEDECACQGDDGVLLCGMGADAPELAEADAWAALGAGSRLAVAFGAFGETTEVAPGRLQVAVRPDEPFGREVFLLADTPTFAGALVAWQPGGRAGRPLAERIYEAAWTLAPDLVRVAAMLCLERTAHALPGRVERELVRCSGTIPGAGASPDAALGLAERVLAYVGRPAGSPERRAVFLA